MQLYPSANSLFARPRGPLLELSCLECMVAELGQQLPTWEERLSFVERGLQEMMQPSRHVDNLSPMSDHR